MTDDRNRRNVADEIEGRVVVKRRVDCVCRGHRKQRIAVRPRIRDDFGTDVGAGARSNSSNNIRPRSHNICADFLSKTDTHFKYNAFSMLLVLNHLLRPKADLRRLE
jgi:hypothetical protein